LIKFSLQKFIPNLSTTHSARISRHHCMGWQPTTFTASETFPVFFPLLRPRHFYFTWTRKIRSAIAFPFWVPDHIFGIPHRGSLSIYRKKSARFTRIQFSINHSVNL
jgi:hypothetical protein